MATNKRVKINDFSKPAEQLTHVAVDEMMPLPAPYDKVEDQPGWKEISKEKRTELGGTLDDTIAVGLPRPKTPEE